MAAFFNIGNFYVDLISVIIVVILILSIFVGYFNGFLKQLITFGQLIVSLLISFLLCKAVGELIYNWGAGEYFVGVYEPMIISKNEMFSTVVTEANRSYIMSEGLAQLNSPSVFIDLIAKGLDPYVPAAGGETIGKYMAIALAHLTTQGIGFVALCILSAIVFGILKLIAIRIRKLPVLGGIDKFLGIFISIALTYLFFDALLFGFSFLLVDDSWGVAVWFKQTIMLKEEGAFTISKFIFEHSITAKIAGLFIK